MSGTRLAACGIDCTTCDQYKVTIHQDMQAAAALVEWFKSQGWITPDEGAEAVMKMAPLCKGCWDITEDCFWSCGCGRRDFRICCTERKLAHCGQCTDFPCADYVLWAEGVDQNKAAMDHLLSLKKND